MDTPDMRQVFYRFKSDDHLNCRAVGIADYVARMIERILSVHFRHNQRNIGIHPESGTIIDHQSPVASDYIGIFLRHGCAGRSESDINAAEV